MFRQRAVMLRGWTFAHRLTVEVDGTRHPVSRRIHRGDVIVARSSMIMETHNQHGRVGFEICIPWFGGPITLLAEDVPDSDCWTLPGPTKSMIRAGRRRATVAFGRDLVCAAPTVFRYLLSGRKSVHRERLRTLLRLSDELEKSLLINELFLTPVSDHVVDLSTSSITIVLPVYNAFDLLIQAVDRVERNTDLAWHLVLVDDASPDPRVRPWLTEWVAQRPEQVTLLINTKNLGFIGSINRGLQVAARRGDAVVLLNSDAMVPVGWASRLLRPILEDDRVASVTPMSNDATILSVPWMERKIALKPGDADVIDAAARRLSSKAKAELPTGIGYCMAMSRAALDLIPELDRTFGLGYGEEVDWCRKTMAVGMSHVGIGNLFVEHIGGESFGLAHKTKALEGSAKIIRTRYPDFDNEVQHFIAVDPLLTARLCLALARAAAEDPHALHIYIGHSLGGGAEHWLTDRIEERRNQSRASVVIRVGGARRFRIELHSDGDILTGETDHTESLRNMILRIPRRYVVYSCGVGDERPWELPDILCDLATGEGTGLEIQFHDYFPISPSLNLLNEDGSYTGVPPTNCNDPAHQISGAGTHVSLQSWRDRWHKAAQRATQLTVFSNSSAEIVGKVWPSVRPRITCRPHEMLVEVPVLQPLCSRPGVIAVLGAIGGAKGAKVVSDLAYYLNRVPNAPTLMVVGEFDHSYPLPSTVKITGRYDSAHLPKVLSASGVTAWLMPSIWPETYSFTTREMLATGLPVMAFDLGAQGEAVRAAANGHIVDPDPAAIHDCYRRLRGQI